MISKLSAGLARALWVLAITLTLAALLLTAVRLALPLADRYRDPLVTAIAGVLGHQVEMDRFSVRLLGLSPRVRFDGVTITDARDPARPVRFEIFEVQVDPIRTLLAGYPVIEAIRLAGVDMEVNRRSDGVWQVRGLEALIRGDPRPIIRFLAGGELQIEGGTVRILDPSWVAQPPPLAEVRLRLVNRADGHHLDLQARPLSHPEADAGGNLADARLRILAHLQGAGLDPQAWSGETYLELGGADLSALVPPRLLPEGRLPAVTENARIEVWLDLRDGALADLRSRVGLRGLHLSPAALVAVPDSGPLAGELGKTLSFDRLTGLARLRPQGESWSLAVRDLAASIDGVDLPDLDLDLELDRAGRPGPRRLDLRIGELDLGSLSRLVDVLPGARAPLVEALLRRSPRGKVTALGLFADWPAGGEPRWRAGLAGEGLGLDALDGLPGFDGLGLVLSADERGGTARLGSTDLRLDLAPIFADVLKLDRFEGDLGWHRPGPGGWALAGHRLAIGNPDLTGRARFELEIPPPGAGAGPELDLRAALSAGDISRAGGYLPTGIMHPHLTGWLGRALVGGRLERADLILRGPIGSFPFAEHEGRFEVIARVEDGTLDYLGAWPLITQASATLRFVNAGLGVELHSGRLFDTPLLEASASIPDLRAARSIVIAGRSQGPLSDATRLLRESPLSGRLGGLGEVLKAEGEVTLDLDLDIPLVAGPRLEVVGRGTVHGPATLTLKDSPITLTDLAGGFGFTLDSVTAQGVTGSLWGRPVEIAVATLNPGQPETAATEIRAQGRVAIESLAGHLPSPLWQLATGEADLGLTLTLGPADADRARVPIAFDLRSDLRGLAIALPEPLGKPANSARALRLSGTLEPGRALDLRGGMEGLGLDLRLDLAAAAPTLERGRVRLGASEAPAADAAGLVVDGRIERLDLDAWSSWLRGPGAKLLASGGVPEGGVVKAVDLRVDRLDAGRLALEELSVEAAPGSGEWELRIEASELAGRLVIPADDSGRPWDLALERLDLGHFIPKPGAEAEAAASGDVARPAGGRTTPLDVRVSDLRWGEASLGRLALEIRPEGEGLRVPSIEFTGLGETRLKGRAATRPVEEGMRSSIELGFEASDTGPLLGALDYASVLSAGALEGGVDLAWPGTLGAFSLASAEGDIRAQMGQGRLLGVDPGLGRMIGFLNLGALGRRLSLDFSDIYDDGFSFESIDTAVSVESGRAVLRRFEMDGPAGRVSASGFTDLARRTFDQTVTVEPKIGSSVAIASAVAGGPVVGAAVYLVDKVAGGAIDKLGSFQYRITGPWDAPIIEPVGWEPFAEDATAAAAEAAGGAAGPTQNGQSSGGEPPEAVNHFLE